MKMKILSFYTFVVYGIMITSTQAAGPPVPIHNKTSLYFHNQPIDSHCPQIIAPGKTESADSYWCGYVACATQNYDSKKGCLEWNSKKTELTQGGYALWFSLSLGGNRCGTQMGSVYQCIWNNGVVLKYAPILQTYSTGPHKDQPVELTRPDIYAKGPRFRGINLSGLEYDGTFVDALFQHPDIPDARYFISKGMNTIRLPIRWEFLVADENNSEKSTNPLSTNVNIIYLDSVHDTVEKYLKNGLSVVLDLHNYMRFCPTGPDIGQANEPTDPVTNQCQLVTKTQLSYIWGYVLAEKFSDLAKQYPDHLIFEIMNEPFSVTDQTLKTEDLFDAEVAAVKEIRNRKLNNYILLSGNNWDSLHGWITDNGNVFTADKLRAAGVTNLDRIAIDVHQYFDDAEPKWSGTHSQCAVFNSYEQFKQAFNLDQFSDWTKKNGLKIFLGEFGAANNDVCRQDINFMLRYVNENPEFIGWTAWRANRHGNTGFGAFNYLQAEDDTVYGANGHKDGAEPGTGIVQGPANGLMDSVFSYYLTR